jgi:hypothetical protein
MHTLDFTGRMDQQMIVTIKKAGISGVKWEEANENMKTRKPKTWESHWEKPKDNFQVIKCFPKDTWSFKTKKLVNRDD